MKSAVNSTSSRTEGRTGDRGGWGPDVKIGPPKQTDRLAEGIRAVEGARRSLTRLKSGERPVAAPGYEVVRAERSPAELKRLRRLDDGPAAIGDARSPSPGATIAATTGDGPVATSAQPAALYLKDLTLNRSFNTFRRTNQIYVTAIAWDLSGQPPRVFPPPELADGPRGTYAMKPNETLRFVGDGLQLWPQQPVKGGLNLQLIVMESDSDLRKLGAKIGRVREAVDNSDLTAILTAIGAGATGGTSLVIQQAARTLSKVVEGILTENNDDLVATFHGTYGAENIAGDRTDSYDRRGASVTLGLRTPEPPNQGAESPGASARSTPPSAPDVGRPGR